MVLVGRGALCGQAVRSLDVYICTARNQLARDCRVTLKGRDHQGSDAVFVLNIEGSAAGRKRIDNLSLSGRRRQNQSVVAVLISLICPRSARKQ